MLEFALFSLLLLAGLVPVARSLAPRWGRSALLLFFLAVPTMLARWAFSQRALDEAARHAAAARISPREGRPGGYVSSDQCRFCHPSEYDSWHRTYHRTMTQYASPDTVRAPFDGVVLTSVDTLGESYRLERRGDELWVDMMHVRRRITLATGSHHMQAYWVAAGEGNGQFGLPFTYLFDDQRWVPRRDAFLLDPDSPWPEQVWNTSCILCHSTAGQPRVMTNQILDTRTAELGIACEACHGPASEHVRTNENALRRYALHLTGAPRGDRTIINPARLDAVRSSQVCGNCHGIKCLDFSPKLATDGYRYRPGDDMEASAPMFRATQHATKPCKQIEGNEEFFRSRYWSDGMVRVSGREYGAVIESPCNRGGQFSCLSCHSMHASDPDDQLAKGMRGNEACLGCHDRYRGDSKAHTHHEAGSPGSECYNCHMPYATYGLLKAIRNHFIDSPSVKNTLETGRPNACNLCHLDKSLQWTRQRLSEWYGVRSPAVAENDRLYSAAILWALRGDAGQRALVAYAMGWDAAQRASGRTWMVPFLAALLDDRYAAVRYVAYRSLRRLPGYGDFQFDYIGIAQARRDAKDRALGLWRRERPDRTGPELLIDSKGALMQEPLERFLRQQDDHAMFLAE